MNELEIVRLYNDENKSTYQIAKIHNTYPNKIRRILVKHGVEIKSKSEAQKNALETGAASIPTKGVERTPEERLLIGKAMKKHWLDMPKGERKRRSELSKAQWDQMSAEEQIEMRRLAHEAMREAGKEGSKFEKWLYQELTDAGFVVEFHKTDLLANDKLEIDMYLPELKAIIEVDGPSHFKSIWGEEKLRKQQKADQNKEGLVLSRGYVVIRVITTGDSVGYTDRIIIRDKVVQLLNNIETSFPKNKKLIEIKL
jgi:very-short-patch-repair endonuclease